MRRITAEEITARTLQGIKEQVTKLIEERGLCVVESREEAEEVLQEVKGDELDSDYYTVSIVADECTVVQVRITEYYSMIREV